MFLGKLFMCKYATCNDWHLSFIQYINVLSRLCFKKDLNNILAFKSEQIFSSYLLLLNGNGHSDAFTQKI